MVLRVGGWSSWFISIVALLQTVTVLHKGSCQLVSCVLARYSSEIPPRSLSVTPVRAGIRASGRTADQFQNKRVVIITAPLCTFIVICNFIAICSQKVCYEHAKLCTRLSLWFLFRRPDRQQQAVLAKRMEWTGHCALEIFEDCSVAVCKISQRTHSVSKLESLWKM